ncbi:MAG: UDP-3-O-(3-hydroxymyristoyl)glucosamine N-acyltransferase, partial [Pseudomonadota bacterium]
MGHRVSEIAEAVGLEGEGDLSLTIRRPAEPASASADDLALAMNKSYAAAVTASAAQAAILWPGADWRALGLKAALFAPRARVTLAAIGEIFEPDFDLAPGIHPTALIDPQADVSDACSIGPFAVIGPGAKIGRGAQIAEHCSIGRAAQIGAESRLYPGVRIGREVRIGLRAI